jgi:tetratricopeptide (TPR) repeat protein
MKSARTLEQHLTLSSSIFLWINKAIGLVLNLVAFIFIAGRARRSQGLSYFWRMEWLNTDIGPLKDLISFLNSQSRTNNVHKKQLIRVLINNPKGLLLFLILSAFLLASCHGKDPGPSAELIDELNLKRGEIISCGSPDKEFGSVEFEMSCSAKLKTDFNLAMELLHSFEYDESEKAFAKVIDQEPGCAMAYWGIAMCNFHPLWTPPTEPELQKGAAAIKIARAITQKSKRESDYIDAIAEYYKDWNTRSHHARCIDFEKKMEKLHADYPDDKEAALFYVLALDAAAEPTDKTYANQKKAGAILAALYPTEPNHPGILHYIIHTYDYPGLAILALPAARKYASVAPSSAHALHMPSHIFTRLGLWDEAIKSNLLSVAAAKCYAQSADIKGHWDEELHGLDYLVYAYLQKGENDSAKEQMNYLETIEEVHPANFKVAYAFAAIPSRFFLENKNWKEASTLQMNPVNFPWKNFPWQEAIIHFTRIMGCAHLGNLDLANSELVKLRALRDTLRMQKDPYKTNQVDIQINGCEAWIKLKMGKRNEALDQMRLAADMEDSTEKHPVTPGSVIPARELLGDMYLQTGQPEMALEAYEADLEKNPNRFNGLYGAGLAAERSGDNAKAILYYRQLLSITDGGKCNRPERDNIKLFLIKH